jgi:hypothetical protein
MRRIKPCDHVDDTNGKRSQHCCCPRGNLKPLVGGYVLPMMGGEGQAAPADPAKSNHQSSTLPIDTRLLMSRNARRAFG